MEKCIFMQQSTPPCTIGRRFIYATGSLLYNGSGLYWYVADHSKPLRRLRVRHNGRYCTTAMTCNHTRRTTPQASPQTQRTPQQPMLKVYNASGLYLYKAEICTLRQWQVRYKCKGGSYTTIAACT